MTAALKTTGPPSEMRRSQSSGPHSVFFLLDSFNTGGTETQAVELAARLDPSHYRTTMGCLRHEGPLRARVEAAGIPVLEFHPRSGIKSLSGVYQFLRLASFLHKERIQVVHTHDLWSNLIGIPAARLAGIPVIISSRRDLSDGEWYTKRNRGILRCIQKLSTLILSNSEAVRNELLRVDAFAPGKIRVVHNGVDLDRFKVRANRKNLFPELRHFKLVVMVGNMHTDVKGHPWFIQGAAEVVRGFPNVRFLLVGEGAMRPRFEELARETGIREQIVFLGHRSDIPEVLSCCDVAVLSSTAEGLPNALLEYLAAGLPTIATAAGGNLEIINDGVTGLLVPPRDPHALARAMLRVLENPELAAALACAGQRYVEQNFGFEQLIAKTSELYSELLERRGRD
jgi:L-malate glycosyltransferase